MVRHLSQQLNKTDYLNTQEAAYSFLALGKFMRRISQDKVTATITADGKTIGNFNGPELVLKKGIAGKISMSILPEMVNCIISEKSVV